MIRFINYFIIGLLVGSLALYQHARNKQLQVEIQALRDEAMIRAQTAGHQIDAAPSDKPLMPENQIPEFTKALDDITSSRQNALTRAIALCRDAVVGINVTQVKEIANPFWSSDPLFRMLYEDRVMAPTIKKQVHNLGSGFIISQDGYIVTNQHVVQDASEVMISTTDGEKYPAIILGTDPLLDMALLKIEAHGLPSIPLGDSENSIVGEWAIAVGNPYGLFDVNDQPSVSVGVVSALHRDFESPIDGRLYTDMIQTDASINHGNSGGPLVNAEGVAIGMNTLIFSESGGSIGIGFAIPAHRILASINDLRTGGVNRDYWIGLRAENVSPLRARLNNLKDTKGAVVRLVERNSPAALAGIRLEDIILEINQQQISNATDASAYFKSTDLRVGDRVVFKISRKGTILQIPVVLVALPGSTPAPK